MNEAFVVNLKGKSFVLYAGLVDAAHQQGLKSIDTELLQIPTDENGKVAITKAGVEMEDGRTFAGIGDASPENVSRNIAPHIIRQSETRAKARALRDALNVGMAALEELGDADDVAQPQGVAQAAQQRPARQQQGSSQTSSSERVAGGATKKQIIYIAALAKDIFGESGVEVVEENIGKGIEEISGKEASDLIKRLSAKKEATE